MTDALWLKAALERTKQGMGESARFLQIWNEKIQEDPIALMQTGLMLLLDKPAYFVIPPGMVLPENLRRLARATLEADISTEAGRLELAAWIKEIAVDLPMEAGE